MNRAVDPQPGSAARFVIREAVSGDKAALADLAAETFPLACPPHLARQDIEAFIAAHLTREVFEAAIEDPAQRVIVIAEPGESAPSLLGYALIVVAEPDDPAVAALIDPRPVALLSKLYLRTSAQGNGRAVGLLDAAAAAARELGAVALWLGVNQFNARAIAFYQRQGFTRIGFRSFVVGERTERDEVYLLGL